MNLILHILDASWQLLLASSIYILFGLTVSGLLKAFLDPNVVIRHLGRGRFASVIKAALIGIPIPLCSCGVLPAALSLKKHGANNGATTAFMIATPESGVDSIAITYALMGPVMAIARPMAAFFTAVAAGVAENLIGFQTPLPATVPEPVLPPAGCCEGAACSGPTIVRQQVLRRKISAGMKYALKDFWGDLAGWFFLGILLAGLITTLIPEDIFSRYLGSGLPAMLLMLVIGIPLYICATASTPIAAALILKGVSPGAALVFLLAGPATNVAALTVLFGILGKRAAAVYLAAIALCSVGCGLLLDQIYGAWGLSAQAMIGQTSEIMPFWLEASAVMILLAISIKPMGERLKTIASRFRHFRSAPPKAPRGCGAT